MATPDFGKNISHADAKAYFNRYVEMKQRHGQKLRDCLRDDLAAQRFFCGRHGQKPEQEDWAYVFGPKSILRLKALLENADSLVIFPGIRNFEPGDPEGESDGRPTLLVFPAKYTPKPDKVDEGDGDFHIGDDGEEHPGSGGSGGSDAGSKLLELPRVLPGSSIHALV